MNRKTLTALLLCTPILSFCSPTAPAADDYQWDEMSPLFEATISEWKAGTDHDRLAAASNYAVTRRAVSYPVSRSGDLSTLRIFAERLLHCLQEEMEGKTDGKVKELAPYCFVKLGW